MSVIGVRRKVLATSEWAPLDEAIIRAQHAGKHLA